MPKANHQTRLTAADAVSDGADFWQDGEHRNLISNLLKTIVVSEELERERNAFVEKLVLRVDERLKTYEARGPHKETQQEIHNAMVGTTPIQMQKYRSLISSIADRWWQRKILLDVLHAHVVRQDILFYEKIRCEWERACIGLAGGNPKGFNLDNEY